MKTVLLGKSVACLLMIATGSGFTPALAAKINISYTMTHDRRRPDPLKNITATVRYEVDLGQSGQIKEDRTRTAGTFADKDKAQSKLGGGQWQVTGENQLKRTIDAAQSTIVMTITTNGDKCKLDVKFALRPGFNEFKYKRIDNGTMAFYGEPSSVSTTCAIGD